MKFRPLHIYTHSNMLDAAIFVLKSFYVQESQKWKLKVRWVLRSGLDLGCIERIEITRSQINNWYEITQLQT